MHVERLSDSCLRMLAADPATYPSLQQRLAAVDAAAAALRADLHALVHDQGLRATRRALEALLEEARSSEPRQPREVVCLAYALVDPAAPPPPPPSPACVAAAFAPAPDTDPVSSLLPQLYLHVTWVTRPDPEVPVRIALVLATRRLPEVSPAAAAAAVIVPRLRTTLPCTICTKDLIHPEV
jgi:hypothetical protein